MLIPLNAKPYKLFHPEEITELNKKLNSPSRVARKRRYYLETKKTQEKIRHGEQLSNINKQRTTRSKRSRTNK